MEKDVKKVIKYMQARLDDRARRLQELKQLPEVIEQKDKEIAQLKTVVQTLSRRHYRGIPLPPEGLRLNVGTTTAAANYWARGIASSTRVMEIFDGNAPLLDLGCGSGRTYRYLLEPWRSNYQGTDVDGTAIEWLRAYANVKVCNDNPPLPYSDGTFGGIFAFSVLTHIPAEKHRAWYEEIYRLLRLGGSAYLTTQNFSVLSENAKVTYKKEFETKGYVYIKHEGHYKDAVIVSEQFTRKALEGLFEVEQYKEHGYNNMDAFLVKTQ